MICTLECTELDRKDSKMAGLVRLSTYEKMVR